MKSETKRWLAASAAGIAGLVLVAALVLSGNGDGGGNGADAEDNVADTTSSAAPSGATIARPSDDGREEVIVSGIRGSLEASLFGPRDPGAVVEAITAEDIGRFAFRATDACQAGSSAFEIDLALTFTGLNERLVAIDTQQAPAQTAHGLLDLDTGEFIIIGGGTGYQEIYLGAMLPVGPPDAPTGVAIAGLNIFTPADTLPPIFTINIPIDGALDIPADAGLEAGTHAEILGERWATIMETLKGTLPEGALSPDASDDDLSEIAQRLADILTTEDLPPPLNEIVQGDGTCALAVAGVTR